MNELDRRLHDEIHRHMMSVPPDRIFSSRTSVFAQVERDLGIEVQGTVLDAGCGSGYASIWLAKNKPAVKKVYAQEASRPAVEELLPRNISFHGVGEKVEPLLGSFDALPLKNALDFVVAFGSLHHSPCLYSTMKSIGEALRDGGYLIAQEPVMPNTTSNRDYIDKYDIVEDRFGMKIRNGDRVDNFFREAEYITAAAFSGLDLLYYEDFEESLSAGQRLRAVIGRQALRGYARLALSTLNGGDTARSPDNDPHRYEKTLMRKVLVFKRHRTDYIPHLWKGLKAT